MSENWLWAFADESNKIEGMPAARSREVEALDEFVCKDEISISDLETYVSLVAMGHRLRRKTGLNVRVGNHIAPPGGPQIEADLEASLANPADLDAFEQHVAYETLHPFTDGNGRSGRALWLWRHLHGGNFEMATGLGFLHSFYYETLAHSRAPA